MDMLPTVGDTDQASRTDGEDRGRCPVDHAPVGVPSGPAAEARCPVDHAAHVPPTSGPVAPLVEDTFAPFACPMGFGAPDADGAPTRSRRRGYFVPGVIALLAMVGVGALVNFGGLDHGSPTRLAGSDVSTFLAQGIQAQQGLSSPPSITCPASEPVRAGLSFSCQWSHDGGNQVVRVTETTAGQFRFSLGS